MFDALRITTTTLGASVLSGCGVWTFTHTVYKLSDVFPLENDTDKNVMKKQNGFE